MNIFGIIYKITNLSNGKIYIGQTVKSIDFRWKSHIFTSFHNPKYYIHRAINKYGVENFKIEQIDIAYSLDDLNQKEYGWIIKENCLAPNGYNLRAGGDAKGISEETRQKLSNIHKNRIFTDEHRKNLSKSMKGRKYSDDVKEKFRKAHLGKLHTEEAKRKMSLSKMNHLVSENTRQKISETHINKPKSLEHRQKISQTLMNHDPGIWYYHPESLISKRILNDEEIPIGFVKGRPEKDTNKNGIYYHHITTNENKIIKEGQDIPEGFVLGKYIPENTSSHSKNKKWYYNPANNNSIMLLETDTIPEGFIKGRGPKSNWSRKNENL